MKKILIPPLAPLALLYALCIFVVIDEFISPVLIVNGTPDNAPLRAAIIIPLLTPFFYACWVIINTLDYLIGRATPSLPWLSTIAITLGLGGLFFGAIFPNGNSPKEIPILAIGAMAIAAVQVFPMSFWRRRIKDKKAEQSLAPYGAQRDADKPNE